MADQAATTSEGRAMIHDPHAPAARTLDLAAMMGNSSQAVLDETREAAAARRDAKRYRAALETLRAHLGTKPPIVEHGHMSTSNPDSVLWVQRSSTRRREDGSSVLEPAPPEPHWGRVMDFLTGVLLTPEGAAPKSAEEVLEDLHVKRRNESLVMPAKQMQIELYNQADGVRTAHVHRPAPNAVIEGGGTWQPTPTAPASVPAAVQPAIPTPQHVLTDRADTELTTVIPAIQMPTQGGAKDAVSGELPAAAQPDAAEAAGRGEPRDKPSPAGSLPTAMASSNDGHTETMDLASLRRAPAADSTEPSPGEPEPDRMPELAGARGRGKNAGRAQGSGHA